MFSGRIYQSKDHCAGELGGELDVYRNGYYFHQSLGWLETLKLKYVNIVLAKISPQKECKIVIIFSISHRFKHVFGCSKDPSHHRDGSFEHPQHLI